jgi:hypothetical protein
MVRRGITCQDRVSHQATPDFVVRFSLSKTIELHDLSMTALMYVGLYITCVDMIARMFSMLSVTIMLIPIMRTSTIRPGTPRIF